MNMVLVDFMNTYPDWRERLAAKPYYLRIHDEKIGDTSYTIVKYSAESDFGIQLVREARGPIFTMDENGEWICVARAFDKFFNWAEKWSDVEEIDWETAEVQQKVDGTLLKIWFDNNQWIVSTNGMIDAFNANCGDTSFGTVAMRIIDQIPEFWSSLDSNYCYMFELTSSQNRIVVHYEGERLWYLGRRNMISGEEDADGLELKGLWYPQRYPLYSLSDCVNAAKTLGEDEEGYVVVDSQFHRIKVKGSEYLRLHRIRGNGVLTIARVIQLWQQELLDDFVGCYPEYQEFVDKVLHSIENLMSISDMAFHSVKGTSYDRYEFAQKALNYDPIIRAYMFARYDDKIVDNYEYWKNVRMRTLASYVAQKIGNIKVGVAEDEQ